MGTWGTRLTDDDYAADVVGEYFDLYNSGKEPHEIRVTLENRESENISDSEEGHIFWMALAKAQWDVGSLDLDVLEKVRKIVDTDTDTKSWIARGATEAEVKKRKISIQSFLTKLETENPKPKKRKKTRPKSSPYETGDVLVFQFSDQHYGAAVVFDAEKSSRFGQTGLVSLRTHQLTKPTLEEVKNSEVLVTTTQSLSGWEDRISTSYYGLGYKNVKDRFEKIGNITIAKVSIQNPSYTRWESFFPFVENAINRLGQKRIMLKNFLKTT